jgi:lysophospholipase L1-like esterase
MNWLRLIFSLLPFIAAMQSAAERPPEAAPFLPGVKRILFLGDSITQSGQYVDDIETLLRLHLPDRHFDIVNCGLSSETVSGLSEEGHAGGQFPRPDLHERLDRILAKVKPDLVFACYGMNDGIYLPLDPGRFEKFQAGMLKLHEKVIAAGGKIIHITPPVFDPLPIQKRVAAADHADVNHPFEGYNDVLDAYSNWLMGQQKEGWRVIDLHTAMKQAIADARKDDPKFTFSGDGVHPNDAGHWLIATTIVKQLPAPFNPGDSTFGTRSDPKSRFARVNKLVRERGRILSDAWLTDIGHKRPMKPGLPLEVAQSKAAVIESRINAVIDEK